MKNIFKTGMFAVLAIILVTACEPQAIDDYELGTAPTAEDLNFSMEPTAESNNIIAFTNTSEMPGVAVWDFGNGSTSKGQVVEAQYPLKGSYEVTLTLATSGGSATLTKTIDIAENDMALLDHPLYTQLTGGVEALEGKTWVFDQYHAGHFGVGPVESNSADWWNAAPNDKLECSLYHNTFTFKQVGVEFIWENNGMVYTNQAGVDALAAEGYTNATVPPAGDFDVEYTPADNYSFTLNTSDSTIVLSNGAFLGHYAGTSTYKILSISDNEMYLKAASTVEPGNGWFYRFVPEELNVEPQKPELPLKAEPLSEDFEDESFDVVFDGQEMGDLTSYSYSNPAPVGANSSSKVALYQKQAGTFYSNMFFVADGYKFDLGTQNKITMKVYIPSYNDYETENNVAGSWITNTKLLPALAVKLQNSEKGDMAWETQTEIIENDIVMDEWVELTFDFSGVADREDYDKIVVQFGMEGHDGGGVFFFDDFRFHE